MKRWVVLVSIMGLCGCNSKAPYKIEAEEKVGVEKKGECFKIDVVGALEDTQEFKIPYSSFIEEIEYIPLETTDSSLIGEKRHGIFSCVTKDRIIADMNVFNRSDGSFISKLSQQGQGPKEYTYIKSIAADDERKEYYIHDAQGSKIMVYGYDNNYKFTLGGNGGGEIIPLGNGNLLVNRSDDVSTPYFDYFVINVESGKVVYRHVSSALKKTGDINQCPGFVKGGSETEPFYVIMGKNKFWNYNGKLCYYEYLTDSLFLINKDLKPEPIGYLSMKGLKMTKEQWKTPLHEQDFYTWRITNFFETNESIFVGLYSFHGRTNQVVSYQVEYSKKDEKVRCTKDFPLFINDIDLGEDFFAIGMPNIVDKTYVYKLLSPISLKETIEKRGSSAYQSSLPKAFKDMTMKLKDDDNPVVCIMTLK